MYGKGGVLKLTNMTTTTNFVFSRIRLTLFCFYLFSRIRFESDLYAQKFGECVELVLFY